MTDHNGSIFFFSSMSPLQALRENSGFLLYPILLLLFLFVTSCNESFNPWEENGEYHFSIYGYLDASADTQWVRVMPVREDLFLEPKPIDAVVTLEHIESGEIVEMNDSLFEYSHNAYAYNFWSTMDLQPNHSYRITATNNDKNSHVEVTLPEDFPTPLVRMESGSGNPSDDFIFIEGVERLADVRTIHYMRLHNSGEEYMIPFVHIQDTIRQVTGDFTLKIDPREDQNTLGSLLGTTPRTIFRQQIFIASAGPDFHYFPSIDEKIVALPEGISNVENGTGYLAGLVSKTIPYKSCSERGTVNLIPCDLESYPWSENFPVWDP